MPLILILFITVALSALTAAGWYSVSVLIGGPVFDADKMPAIMCGWGVLSTVGVGGLVIALGP